MKSKPNPSTAPRSDAAEEHPHVYVSPTWRVVVHIWLLIHLTALIAAPLVFATMGAPLPRMLYDLTRPYMDLLFLDHGYAFFAPEVGPNHLVEYRVWPEDSSEPEVGRFPNLQEQWPRLLYHRHFMLSEYLNNRFEPSNLRRDFFPDQQTYEDYLMRRAMFERMRDSFATHLQEEHHAAKVELVRIEHRQPHPPEFENGLKLNDESLYTELPDVLPRPQAMPEPPTNIGPPRFPFPYAPPDATREPVQ